MVPWLLRRKASHRSTADVVFDDDVVDNSRILRTADP
jgi:hypothetical protein